MTNTMDEMKEEMRDQLHNNIYKKPEENVKDEDICREARNKAGYKERPLGEDLQRQIDIQEVHGSIRRLKKEKQWGEMKQPMNI